MQIIIHLIQSIIKKNFPFSIAFRIHIYLCVCVLRIVLTQAFVTHMCVRACVCVKSLPFAIVFVLNVSALENVLCKSAVIHEYCRDLQFYIVFNARHADC